MPFRKPSPAMLVALFALFVALGGSSYAALTLPKSSVGSGQLKNNSVTSPKVKPNSLLLSDIRASQRAQLQGAQGPAGAKGDRGPTGPKGDPGSVGPVAAVSTQADVALASEPTAVLDLATLNMEGDSQITLPSQSRVVANASIVAYTNAAMQSEVGCFLYISDGTGPNSGLTPMEPDGAYSEMPATQFYSVSLPLVGSQDKPAGTYNVQVQCEEFSGNVQFSHGSLVVWAASS